MRTARSRTSGENLFAFVIAQSSQRNEPPQNPGRFNFAGLTHIERFPYRVTTMRFRHLLEETKLDES
jgi:hypothetical protein